MDLFLYGTLLDPDLRRTVTGQDLSGVPATLADHRVVRGPDNVPVLVAEPGAMAEGLVLAGLDAAAEARLDDYELPFGYALAPVTVATEAGLRDAVAYRPGGSVGHSGAPWNLDAWARADKPRALLAAEEFDLTIDRLGAEAIAANWHMVLHRASARLRAQSEPQPATLRHAAEAGDVELVGPPEVAGRFFRYTRFGMRHRSFGGGQSPVLGREALIGADAALVLPYDPATGEVLLIEQIRSGPLMRGAANPWTLEPVAGIVDAGESPEEAARREAFEEAGLASVTLHPMFAFYASPGNSTDYFHCFAGVADLSGLAGHRGGLEEEHEDLRNHVLPLETALGLIEAGEVNAGPLVAMLLWLDRNKGRLGGG